MEIRKIAIYIKLNLFLLSIKKQKIRIMEIRKWRKAFFGFLSIEKNKSSDYPDRWNVIEGFAKSDIIKIKKVKDKKHSEDPILICVVLNELERMNIFLDHYRKMGIKTFVFLDNGSTDGTMDYLKMQADVELFQTKDAFKSKIKIGWINRIISYYGTDHWYLVVDADELLVWQDIEEWPIQNVIRYFDQENITRARALMIDMYPREVTWNTNVSFERAYSESRFFDYNTYYHRKENVLYLVSGGPRKRMFGIDAWLTKYPLFRLGEEEIMCNPHTIYPYDNKESACYLAILHYKFLTRSDQQKMRKYARKENYACDSAEYKLYVKKLRENADNFKFYFEDSAEYHSSKSLARIREIGRIPFYDR